MTLVQGIILSLVQGITEFLPVSSKGHLNLAQQLLGLTPSLSFDIFLNTATLLSVLFFFRHQIRFFFGHLPHIFIGSLPVIIIGLFFKSDIEVLVTHTYLLPYALIFLSLLLFITKFIPPRDQPLTLLNSFIIGVFQALALVPGVSRSGSTIFAGLLLGLSPASAFNFSFSLFIPASFGAIVLDIGNLTQFQGINYYFSFVTTFVVGLIALHLLQRFMTSRRFWLFGVYTFFLSILLLLSPSI